MLFLTVPTHPGNYELYKYIYKIIDSNEWKIAKDNGSYSGSSKDLKDGYIHFSGEEQVDGYSQKILSKLQKDLILLKVETLHLNSLVWEQACKNQNTCNC